MSGVCIIVGAGSGVSMGVARRFAREGYAVGLVARRAEALAALADELRGAGFQAESAAADAASADELVAALTALHEQLGPADVLVYNAAAARPGRPSGVATESLVADFRVNVAGALASAQQVIPAMRQRGHGTILFTGGGLALSPAPDYASLAIGKAGIRSLAYSLGDELEGEGIHVATVTIAGFVQQGSHFDPDLIAEHYWQLHSQPQGQWEREVVYR